MSLIRYLRYLAGQLIGFAIGTRRPLVVLIVLVAALAVLVALVVQVAAPIVIYPLL